MLRLSRNIALLDFILIGILILLVYVFMGRLGYIGGDDKSPAGKYTPTDGSSRSGSSGSSSSSKTHGGNADTNVGEGVKKQDEAKAPLEDGTVKDERVREEIDLRLGKIEDVRSPECLGQSYNSLILTSIIIEFFDYQLYDLKITIGSVLKFTPKSLIKEIIIVDDGSTLDYIIKDAQQYVSGLPNAILIRHESRLGQLKSRVRASKESQAHNLVFLDTTVIVSPGWIEPLLNYVQSEKSVIAVPHYDQISDPVSYQYVPTSENLVATLSWSLTVRMQPTTTSTDPSSVAAVPSPSLHGSVFAVTAEYFAQIGRYDEGLGDSGGHHVELALRTWLCGGSIRMLPCSRVGALNVRDVVRVGSTPNVWRIGETWLASQRAAVRAYVDGDLEAGVDDARRADLAARRAVVHKMKCPHDVDWLLSNVAIDMVAPSQDAQRFGLLKVLTGYCAYRGSADDRLDLGSCRSSEAGRRVRQLTFEMSASGELKVEGRCVQCMDNAYAKAVTCSSAEQRQKWTYDKKDGLLVNQWSKYCLMHVTDPDPAFSDKHRQIAMAQPCDVDTSKKKEFSKWEFIKT